MNPPIPMPDVSTTPNSEPPGSGGHRVVSHRFCCIAPTPAVAAGPLRFESGDGEILWQSKEVCGYSEGRSLLAGSTATRNEA